MKTPLQLVLMAAWQLFVLRAHTYRRRLTFNGKVYLINQMVIVFLLRLA